MARKLTKFEESCLALSESTDIGVMFYRGEHFKVDDVFEDDGSLHIRRDGIRAVFDVGDNQNLGGHEQNTRTQRILDELKIEATATIRRSAFVAEFEDEDCCPHCGGRL